MDRKELEGKKLSDLRVIAATIGISGAENMKKEEIINMIAGGESTTTETSEEKGRRGRPRRKADQEEVQPSLFEEPKVEAESSEVKEDKTDREPRKRARQYPASAHPPSR
jgi:hypothetical protein